MTLFTTPISIVGLCITALCICLLMCAIFRLKTIKDKKKFITFTCLSALVGVIGISFIIYPNIISAPAVSTQLRQEELNNNTEYIEKVGKETSETTTSIYMYVKSNLAEDVIDKAIEKIEQIDGVDVAFYSDPLAIVPQNSIDTSASSTSEFTTKNTVENTTETTNEQLNSSQDQIVLDPMENPVNTLDSAKIVIWTSSSAKIQSIVDTLRNTPSINTLFDPFKKPEEVIEITKD